MQRLVATLKRVANLPPPPIEPDRSGHLKPPHAIAQIWLGCFHGEVKVIPHNHVGVDAPLKPGGCLAEAKGKRIRGAGFTKEILAVVPAIDHVIAGSCEFEP